MRGLWLLVGIGCAANVDGVDTEVGEDTDVADPDVEPLPDDLNGTAPAVNLTAPEFMATNRDGSTRSRPDLIGHPTVIWFYPAAMTGG